MGLSAIEGCPAAVRFRPGVGFGAADCGAVIISCMRLFLLHLVSTAHCSVWPGSYSVAAM